MLVYWFSSNTFSLCQVLFLKIPKVRQFFKIPKRIEQPDIQPVKKGFLEGFKECEILNNLFKKNLNAKEFFLYDISYIPWLDISSSFSVKLRTVKTSGS